MCNFEQLKETDKPVEELAHLVVPLVQGENPRTVLGAGDQPHPHQAVSYVWGNNRLVQLPTTLEITTVATVVLLQL